MENKTCIYCGHDVATKQYVLNKKGDYKFYACRSECLEQARTFNLFEQKNRALFYGLLFVVFAINFFVIYQKIEAAWTYLPIALFGVVLMMYPIPFTKYVTYERFGIKKTILGVRIFAGIIILFGVIAFLLFN